MHLISFLVGALVTLSYHALISFLTNDPLNDIRMQIPNTTKLLEKESRCEFPIVYNKPPKTAGTYIQKLITDWTSRTNRTNYLCGGKRAIETSIYLQECVSRQDDGCGVFNAHIVLTPQAMSILNKRLPNHWLLTSTRYPPHRIVSLFLQLNLYKMDNKSNADEVEKRLQLYLRQFNPWVHYNFHSGENLKGTCPLQRSDVVRIFNLASQFDLVVDANIPEESNVILKDHGLFQFPVSITPVNVRGAGDMKLSEKTLELIQNVSCVEDTLHKALHLRMASLYEKASGKHCIKSARIDDLVTCLDVKERVTLQHSWIV